MADRNTAALVRFQSKVREQAAPAAPTAAYSVAVMMPNRITASTTTVRMPSGMTEVINSRSTSNYSASMIQ